MSKTKGELAGLTALTVISSVAILIAGFVFFIFFYEAGTWTWDTSTATWVFSHPISLQLTAAAGFVFFMLLDVLIVVSLRAISKRITKRNQWIDEQLGKKHLEVPA